MSVLDSATFAPSAEDEEFYRREFTERPVAINCPEHGVNPWLPSIARRLWQSGYSDREIFNLVWNATRGVKHRSIREDEINRAIAMVVGSPVARERINGAREEKPQYDPAYLERKASAITETIDANYLESRSQFTCWNRTPVGFLHKIFKPGEHVWITSKYNSRHGEIWTHTGLIQRFDELDHYLSGHDGVWYLTAPIDGRLHAVERVKSKWNPEGCSFTVLESLAAWLYLLI